jgi:hypothetical protein
MLMIYVTTIKNKQNKLEEKDEAIFDTIFLTQSHAESYDENLGSPFESTS